MQMISKSLQRCHSNADQNTSWGNAQRPDNSFHSSERQNSKGLVTARIGSRWGPHHRGDFWKGNLER